MDIDTPLRQARVARGLLNKDAAALVGCDPSTFSRVERSLQAPNPSLLRRIVSEFGITEAEVLYPSAENAGSSGPADKAAA